MTKQDNIQYLLRKISLIDPHALSDKDKQLLRDILTKEANNV